MAMIGRSSFLALTVLIVGCAPLAFDPAEHPREVVGRVEGGTILGSNATRDVVLDAIDGRDEIGRWEAGDSHALVPPGEHTFTVRRRVRWHEDEVAPNVYGGLVGIYLAIELERRIEAASQETRRTVAFLVEDGYRYEIFDSDPNTEGLQYAVHRTLEADRKRPSQRRDRLEPGNYEVRKAPFPYSVPEDAVPCVPSGAVRGADFVCPFESSQAAQ